MGGLFAPKAKAPATERLSGIQVQSSVYGKPIPRVWGTTRVAPNLIWYGAFTPVSTVTKTKTGGKGGGGTQKTTTYSYKAALMMAVCAGPIVGIRTVYKDKAVFVDGGSTALQQVGLSLATGALGQAPWGYLSTSFPSQALGYSGLAYVYSSAYELSDSGSITNHTFEVVSNTRISGRDDAEPADVISDVVTSIPLWQSGLLASLTNYRNYCLANGLWISPVLDSKTQASSFLKDILDVTNSDVVWSGGQFKIVPRGDTAITANGATYTPDLTPIYDLDDSDFLRNGSDDPIEYSLSRDADAYNYISIEYLDRARGYVQAVVPGIDSAAIAEFGLRKKDTEQRPMICEASVAAKVAQLKVAESSLVRRRFGFTLSDTYFLLEPTDYITVTETGLGLDRVLCRVLSVQETDDGSLDIECEEVLTGAAAAASVTRQPMGGYLPGYDADPGNAQAPVVMAPPLQLVEGSLEMWLASSGGADWGGAEIWVSLDNTTYENTGRLEGPCRFGVTTTALASASDPHVAGTVGINIAAAGGTMDSATQAEVDSAVTLCLVGNEVIAYRDATLTGTGLYTLGYLRRGLFGTTPQAWPAGTRFVRLDGAVASLPYKKEDLGKTVYVKLRSFNVYNRAYQDLSAVSVYSLTLSTLGNLYLNTTVMPNTVGPGSVRVGRDLYPFGTGTTALPGTEILNSQITVDVNGRLTNTGAGLVVVDNSKISLAGLGYTGPTNPTRNVVATGLLANRPAGADGDFYYATDDNNGAGLLYSKIAGAWVADPKAKVLFDSLSATVNGNEATNSAFRSAQASDNAAQAARLTTLDVSYRFPMPAAINKNPNFSSWTGTLPDDWVDWANGLTNTKATGDIGVFAYRQSNPAGLLNYGIQQIMSGKMALGWHVLEAEVTLNSGTLTGAAVHLNWGVSTVTNSDDIRFLTDPDITGAVVGAGTVGRRYRFSKLINITVVPNISVLHAMTTWEGAANSGNAKDLTWHKCLVRQASQSEIDAKVAKDTTIPNLTARVATEEGTRASADSALASRATTLEARSFVKGNLVKGSRPNYDASSPNNLFSRFGWLFQGLWNVSYSVYVDGPYLSQSLTSQNNYTWGGLATNAMPVAAGVPVSVQAILGKFGTWLAGTLQIQIYWYTDVAGTTGLIGGPTKNWEAGTTVAGQVAGTVARWVDIANAVAPAGVQSFRLGINTVGATGNGAYTEGAAWMLKAEYGGTCTTWSDDALAPEIDARVRVEESARASGDSANATQITTVQARLNSPYVNLVRNSSGEFGVFAAGGNPADGNWWLTDTAIVMGIASPSDHVGGLHRYLADFTNALDENFYSIAFEHYNNHMVFGGAFYNNQTQGSFQFEIYGYTGGGAPFGAISTRNADGNNPTTSYVIPAGGWTQITRRVIPSDIPSGCTHFRIVFRWVNYKGYAGLSRLQGHLGQVLPPFVPNNGDAYSLNAQVVQVNSVAVDGRGRAYAISGTQVEVNGRKGGFVMDNNGLVVNFQITADDFRIYQGVGGAFIVPFRVVGGQTQIDDALIRNLNVIPDGGGPSHRVQLRPNSLSGADGASFTFSTAYGGIPLVRAVITSPPALASGETFEVVPTGLSASGFTIRAKKFTPGTPAAQSSGAGSNVGGTPQWQAQKPTSTDGDGGQYTYSFTATLVRVSNESAGGGGFYAEYEASIDIYYNSGSGWVFAYTNGMYYASFYPGNSPNTVTLAGSTTAYLPAIGQHGGAEFGIHPSFGSITAFAGVSYTTTSQSSVVSLPGNFTFEIFPPT